MCRLCWLISKGANRIGTYNRGIIVGIENPNSRGMFTAAQGFHIVRGTPSICITTQKHSKRATTVNHVRLVLLRKTINLILKTHN